MPTYTRNEAAAALGVTPQRISSLIKARDVQRLADRREGRDVLVIDQAGLDKITPMGTGRPRKSTDFKPGDMPYHRKYGRVIVRDDVHKRGQVPVWVFGYLSTHAVAWTKPEMLSFEKQGEDHDAEAESLALKIKHLSDAS